MSRGLCFVWGQSGRVYFSVLCTLALSFERANQWMALTPSWWVINPCPTIWMQFIFSVLWCWQDLGSNLDRGCTSVLEVCWSLECCPENMIYSVCVRFWGFASSDSPLKKGKLSPVVEGVSHTFLSLCSRRLTLGQDAWLSDAVLWTSDEQQRFVFNLNWILLSVWWLFFFCKEKT